MRVRPVRKGQRLLIETPASHPEVSRVICYFDGWPKPLRIEDLLHALCGAPDQDGWYPYNEADERWLCQCLRIASECDETTLGGMAISDSLNLRRTPESLSLMRLGTLEPTASQMAAGGLAVILISKAFDCSREEAADLIRLNLFEDCVAVEG